jgi:hypothetical protein
MGDELQKILFRKVPVLIAKDRTITEGTNLGTAPGRGQGGGRAFQVIQERWPIPGGEKGKKVIGRERELVQIFDEPSPRIYVDFSIAPEDGALHPLAFPASFDSLQEITKCHLSFANNPIIKYRITEKSLPWQGRDMGPADKD